ncbi:MAG: hypothetical protein EXR79_12430 [Myxococcales bacterium]|nr:hypothetical protein [Myxococcales bacterium]
MALFEPFEAWAAADFDAFSEGKRRSNRFNLERARVRHRVASLVEQACDRAGIDRSGLELWTSLDHPHLHNGHVVAHQLAVLCRDPTGRGVIEASRPAIEAHDVARGHAHAGVRVHADGVDLVFAVPELSRERGDLIDVLGDLGALSEAGLVAHVDGIAADQETLDVALLEPGALGFAWLCKIARADALAGAGSSDDVTAFLTAAGPVLLRVLGLAPHLSSEGDDADGRDGASPAPPAEVPVAAAGASGTRTTGPVRTDSAGAAAAYRPFGKAPPPTRVAPPPPPKAPPKPKPIENGARVRLVTGPFAGKVGTVTAMHGGQVQVHLGLMAVKVEAADVRVV